MARIQRLSQELAEKIAAGEVVERPASVVKELMENALDAGASSITVSIAGGGSERITIIDDGCGMDAEDLKRSVERHATSKITSEEDLFSISTMGFRGEALASIGAIAHLSIESKLRDTEVLEGARIEMHGGSLGEPAVVGCVAGTKVEVRDLFFNVPARRKFLRSAQVEAGHILETFNALALASPQVRFDYRSDAAKKICYQALSPEDLARGGEGRVLAVLGEKFRNRFVRVQETGQQIAVQGFVADGGRRGGKDVHFFLNRRPVRDRMLLHALTQGLGEQLPQGAQPACVLWIEMDPREVDVNVHPSKREVKFASSGAVHDLLMRAIRKSVAARETIIASEPFEVFPDAQPLGAGVGKSAVPSLREGVGAAIERFEERRLRGSPERDAQPSACSPSPSRYQAGERLPELHVRDATRPVEQCAFVTSEEEGELRPIGQAHHAYIVCEGDDGALVLIDQHAAHERLGFDRIRMQYAEGSVPQQRLLIPEHLELGATEASCLEERMELLTDAGFEVEPFGGGSLIVKAVPEILGDVAVGPLFARLASELEMCGSSASVEEVRERAFATIACHRQVRAGDRLGMEEMQRLVREIEREGVKHCPHGRPALVRIERSEIEKWFRRR